MDHRPHTYTVTLSYGHSTELFAAGPVDARELAREWIVDEHDSDGDRCYQQRATECYRATLEGPGLEDGGEILLVAIDPPDPDCADDEGHELADDGGPWAHGSEVSHRKVCRRCGATVTLTSGYRDETGWQGTSEAWILPGEPRYVSERPAQLARLCADAHREGRKCADNLDSDYTMDDSDPRGWADEHLEVAEFVQDHGYWLGQYAATYPLCDVLCAEAIEAFYAGLHERACEIADAREAAKAG